MAGISATANFELARTRWRAIVGSENVIVDPPALRAAATATFATSQTIPTILRPLNREQVQGVIEVANERRIPVYTISSGFNWGYGSSVPVADGCALLDLRRMKRIVDFSEDLAYVTVEPGVTQGELYEFLKERGSKLWLDATGSTPASSLIGNTAERGFGHTPYGDHFANACGLEVVLPDGRLLETGFCRFPGARAGSVYRWGVGPSLDGLFSQSSLGVITRMTIWLMPAPEHFEAFFFGCDRDEGLEPLIDALRPLRLNQTLRSALHIGNDYKVISSLRQYPWEELEGRTPLEPAAMVRFRENGQFGAWNGGGGLYGTRRQVAEAKRLLRQALTGRVDKLRFLSDRNLSLASRLAGPLSRLTGWDLSRMIQLVEPVYGLMKGVPTAEPLKSAYWRKRTPIPAQMNPDRDGCGLLWCAPVAPLDGRHIRAVVDLAVETLLTHGFEPMISLTLITERAVACVVTVAYDRDVAGEDEKAMAAYEQLLDRTSAAGYYPYRLGIQSMQALPAGDGYDGLLRSVKELVDPRGILSPGRYAAKS